MNAVLLIAAMLFADAPKYPCLDIVERTAKEQAELEKAMNSFEEILPHYRAAKIDKKVKGEFELRGKDIYFSDEFYKNRKCTEIMYLIDQTKAKQLQLEKNKLSLDAWEVNWPKVGAIGSCAKARILQIGDSGAMLMRFTSADHPSKNWEAIVQKIDSKDLVDDQDYEFTTPLEVIGTRSVEGRKFLLIQPITLDQIKDRAAAERKARDGK